MKKNLRIILKSLFFFCIGFSIGRFFLRTYNWFDWMVLAAFIVFVAFKLYVIISNYMFYRQICEFYKKYKEMFEIFKFQHRERYKSYLVGDKDKIAVYNVLINEIGKMLIEDGERLLQDEFFDHPTDSEIEDIIRQIKELMVTIQTPQE